MRWHFFSNFVANIFVFHPFLSLKGQNMQKLALAGFKQKVIWSNSSESAPSLHIFSHSFKEMDAIYLPGRGQNEIVENCCQQSRSDCQAVQSKPSNKPANIGLSKNLCLVMQTTNATIKNAGLQVNSWRFWSWKDGCQINCPCRSQGNIYVSMCGSFTLSDLTLW